MAPIFRQRTTFIIVIILASIVISPCSSGSPSPTPGAEQMEHALPPLPSPPPLEK